MQRLGAESVMRVMVVLVASELQMVVLVIKVNNVQENCVVRFGRKSAGRTFFVLAFEKRSGMNEERCLVTHGIFTLQPVPGSFGSSDRLIFFSIKSGKRPPYCAFLVKDIQFSPQKSHRWRA
jgi:hypothetical protein